MPQTTLEGLNNLCSRRNYALLTAHSTASTFVGILNCSFMALKEASFPESLGIAFSKGSHYLGIFNFK
jgi:hypothetical protein